MFDPPDDLKDSGRRLWVDLWSVFDFENDPHRVLLLEQACRVADIIAGLDVEAANSPLTVRGSMGQQVISPFIAEARVQRSLLGSLIKQLGLPDTQELAELKRTHLSLVRSAAASKKRRVSL